ncbi:MAG: Stp1/IreP family PP2C-type Ser/Thr phosphatase [Erysipelotrichaceae bacterium]|nr:Stp1/IreP family PP2C-type Ser/Thr phosphatase [Erysipelotrichaceae bacterium]
MKAIAKTDIGLVRSTNEDTYIVKMQDDDNYIAFVFDGMGGHLGGAHAANTTANYLQNAFLSLNEATYKNLGVWLFETLQNINTTIYNQSLQDDNLKGMGTTVSGVVKHNGTLFYAHIGDSRIYLYNKNELEQITTDHTYVNTLLLNGIITYKQAMKHPKRHVLTNALGIKKNVSVDIGQIKLKDGDNLLLCTDGLHNLIDNKKLLKLLNSNEKLEDKADLIMEKALSLGGNDNITFIIMEQ